MLVIAAIGGVALGLFLWWVVFRAVTRAFEWLIYTFGNEQAAQRIEERWLQRGGRDDW